MALGEHDGYVWNGALQLTSQFEPVNAGFASTAWKGREATRLSNGVVELTALTSGGHLAELRFLRGTEPQSKNVFWEAPWITVDPDDDRYEQLAMTYGPIEVGRFLAGYAGHSLCMDIFGAPSTEQAAAGQSLHGEAAVRKWSVVPPANQAESVVRWKVELPIAQLEFEREIRLGNRESVVYVEECVTNKRDTEYAFHWVHHATFGPPFLNDAECSLAASAQRGRTAVLGYEGFSLVKKDREFLWPYAPREGDGPDDVNLRVPFSTRGRGILAGMQMDLRRNVQYIAAINWKLRLCVGYCFRRDDFPWMAVWEENCARPYSPWNGKTQARGMEFGTTPMPPSPGEGFPGVELFDTPTWCEVPARGTRKARYLIFLAELPAEMHSVGNVEVEDDAIRLSDTHGRISSSILADGCEEFLAADNGRT